MERGGEGEGGGGGGGKPKFTPNLTTLRRVKPDPGVVDAKVTTAERPTKDIITTRGRGRGRGRALSVGNGRGLLEAPVSGPFAHGPALSNTNSRGLIGGISMMGRNNKRDSISFVSNRMDSGILREGEKEKEKEKEKEEAFSSLEEYLSKRTIGKHLPITLANNVPEGDTVITDDVYVKGDLCEGKLLLFQLPSCLPTPPDDNLQPAITPIAPSLLGVGEQERAMDIETFNSLQSPNIPTPSSTWNSEGLYGKLRVHRSGRMSLLVNGQVMEAAPSTVQSGLMGIRRAVAIDADYEQSFDVGTVAETVVFVPQIEQLLQHSFTQ
jgi:hypothetical protein